MNLAPIAGGFEEIREVSRSKAGRRPMMSGGGAIDRPDPACRRGLGLVDRGPEARWNRGRRVWISSSIAAHSARTTDVPSGIRASRSIPIASILTRSHGLRGIEKHGRRDLPMEWPDSSSSEAGGVRQAAWKWIVPAAVLYLVALFGANLPDVPDDGLAGLGRDGPVPASRDHADEPGRDTSAANPRRSSPGSSIRSGRRWGTFSPPPLRIARVRRSRPDFRRRRFVQPDLAPWDGRHGGRHGPARRRFAQGPPRRDLRRPRRDAQRADDDARAGASRIDPYGMVPRSSSWRGSGSSTGPGRSGWRWRG